MTENEGTYTEEVRIVLDRLEREGLLGAVGIHAPTASLVPIFTIVSLEMLSSFGGGEEEEPTPMGRGPFQPGHGNEWAFRRPEMG